MSDAQDPHAGQPVLRVGVPVERARLVAILIHGRGASAADILSLRDELSAADVAYLAPQAAGSTWYPYSFLSPISQNEPGITSGLGTIARLIAEVAAQGVPQERVVLLGFSQGACLLAEYVSRHPANYGGVAILTGGLIGPPGTTWEGASLEGTPIVLATSDVDDWVPLARTEGTRDVFTARGGEVTWRVYEGMEHIINDDEVRLVGDLLAAGDEQRRRRADDMPTLD